MQNCQNEKQIPSTTRRTQLSFADVPNLSIGLKRAEDNDRVATIHYPGELQIEAEGRRNSEVLRRWKAGDNEHNKRLYQTWPWITTDKVRQIFHALQVYYC